MSARNSLPKCGACGEGNLIALKTLQDVEYAGVKESIFQQSHKCDYCKAVLFIESDVRENRRAWFRFKKQTDNVPLGCEIAAMRRQAQLTQEAAGELLGGGPVAFSKYESDDIIPDTAMINLLKLAIAYPDTIIRLKEVKQKTVQIDIFEYAEESQDSESSTWSSFDSSQFMPSKLNTLSTMHSAFNSNLSSDLEKSWQLKH